MTETHPMPTSDDAEQAVIAGLLRSPDAIHQLGFLRAADFAGPLCASVFAAIRDLVAAGKPVDWRAVAGSFEGRIEEAGRWLRALTALAPHPLELVEIARTVRDLADRRRIIQLAEDAMARARAGGQPAHQIAAALTGSIGREVGDQGDEIASVGDLAEEIVTRLSDDLPCISTGLDALDDTLGGGLYAGKLYGVVARMKAGKTMLLTTVAYNVAERGGRVLYLPLEMGGEELTQRILARRMAVNSLAFLDRRKRQDRGFGHAAAQAALSLVDLPLTFQTRPRMALDDLRQTIARAAMRDRVRGVVVDYLQLVSGQERGQSQAAHLDHVTQALAEAAKTHGIWILAAAQENQEGNVRGGEGLLMACDVTLRLHRIDGAGGPDRAWLETMVARYVLKRDVGSELRPALELDAKAGPHFRAIDDGQREFGDAA